jgi:hypothetical protein
MAIDGQVGCVDSSFANWLFVPLCIGDDTGRVFIDIVVRLA